MARDRAGDRARGRLVVLGATGATGRRVVRLAAEAGLRPIAVGRRADALRAATAGLDVEIRCATLSPADLDSVLADAAVVVSGVGPSTVFGPQIVSAALRRGAHYVDFSGEPRWADLMARRFAAHAAEQGVVLVPTVGLGIAADLAACRAAEGLGTLRRLTVAYRIVGMRPSVATTRSTVEILAGGAPLVAGGAVTFVPAGRADAPLPGIRFPLPDALVLRTAWPDAAIQSVLRVPAPGVAGAVLAGLGAALGRPAVLGAARRALTAWADRPASHAHAGGGRATATVLAEGDAGARTVIGGVHDVYDVTGRAGFLAARALLAGNGEPGLRSWCSVVGGGDALAREAGVRLIGPTAAFPDRPIPRSPRSP